SSPASAARPPPLPPVVVAVSSSAPAHDRARPHLPPREKRGPMEPYYQVDAVTLYHGDCREIETWEAAQVLVTDPPYGIGWKISDYNGGRRHDGIVNDESTEARDYVLGQWGSVKPAVVFGSPLLPPPRGARQTLVWRKPPDAG